MERGITIVLMFLVGITCIIFGAIPPEEARWMLEEPVRMALLTLGIGLIFAVRCAGPW